MATVQPYVHRRFHAPCGIAHPHSGNLHISHVPLYNRDSGLLAMKETIRMKPTWFRLYLLLFAFLCIFAPLSHFHHDHDAAEDPAHKSYCFLASLASCEGFSPAAEIGGSNSIALVTAIEEISFALKDAETGNLRPRSPPSPIQAA